MFEPLRIAPSQMELLKNIKSQMPLDSRQIDVICKLTRLPLDVVKLNFIFSLVKSVDIGIFI